MKIYFTYLLLLIILLKYLEPKKSERININKILFYFTIIFNYFTHSLNLTILSENYLILLLKIVLFKQTNFTPLKMNFESTFNLIILLIIEIKTKYPIPKEFSLVLYRMYLNNFIKIFNTQRYNSL